MSNGMRLRHPLGLNLPIMLVVSYITEAHWMETIPSWKIALSSKVEDLYEKRDILQRWFSSSKDLEFWKD